MKWINILVFILLCSSCSNENKAPTEASLEAAVRDANKVFTSGDAEAIADLFVISKRQTSELLTRMSKGYAKSDPPVSFNFESCKVSGNMGIALVSFTEANSHFPFFAKWESEQWKFYIDVTAWQGRAYTKKMDLTDAEMVDALILQKWAVSQPLAGASGINAHDRLAWYVPFVPKDLKIAKFYESPSPAMDHEYMWKIRLEDTVEFKKFAEQFLKAPPNADGVNSLSEVPVFASHPEWWRMINFEGHKVYQYRVVVVGSNGG